MSEVGAFVLVSLPLLALLLYMLVEVGRRRDLPIARRIVWIVLLLLVPVVVLAIYIVARPPRSAQISGGEADVSTAERIVLLAERRQRGELTDDEYEQQIAVIASLN